ncbi:hypothetical protein JD77_04545 [Micromonospora olivasterospora]|uniref:Uncharacterized protein n=1 Tax=Micromonospora olivasterospora TaxID=1880 RepID=A0A562IFN5_MICOL|nr:hypothetical protein JD77_04545 [Micromonospora olivasterospora]
MGVGERGEVDVDRLVVEDAGGEVEDVGVGVGAGCGVGVVVGEVGEGFDGGGVCEFGAGEQAGEVLLPVGGGAGSGGVGVGGVGVEVLIGVVDMAVLGEGE